jgi:hypothetical protein
MEEFEAVVSTVDAETNIGLAVKKSAKNTIRILFMAILF